ncbi:Starch-binding associating with outer membrane [bacterium A37T11]|nr:Starch-binding associating with outer membrane [bacterium A37T11]
MITKLYKLILTSILISGFTSCSNFLDQVPDDVLTIDDIFNSKKYVDEYLANIYSNIPNELTQRYVGSDLSGPWTPASDEGFYNWDFNYGRTMTRSTWSNTDWEVALYWNEWYKSIRNASDFISKIDGANSVEVSSLQKIQSKAEARALRALYYYWLLRIYGPVPLVTKVYPPDTQLSELKLSRSPFDDCINYVVGQLDSAYTDLPVDPANSEKGRITKGIVKAYKVEVLMLAASPLFNGNSDLGSLVNKDGTALVNQTYQPEKWKAAADAAKDFINEFVPGTYDLYTVSNADPFVAAYKATCDVVTSDWNKEWIFARTNSGTYLWHDVTPLHVGYSSKVRGFGALGATQRMVDDYFMANGLSINESGSGYVSAGFSSFKAPFDVKERNTYNQWTNREPRFYTGITYNNSYWLYQSNDDKEVITNMEFSGNSGRSQSTSDVSPTGYIIRKNATATANSRGSLLLRLAQIYLDYAEALNEYDPGNAEIVNMLNLIRSRAGIPAYGTGAGKVAIGNSQAAVREAIRKERRVELAFENVRYFDTRRWKIANETNNGPVYGLNMFASGNAFYTPTVVDNWVFKQRDYLWPIQNDEILKNENMVQNPGW